MNKGFTILELLAAILVIVIGVLGAYSVTQQILSYTISSSFRLTSAYLAKEGVEIIRNIRDTNWLEGEVWNNGLTTCATGCEADYSNNPPLDLYASREFQFDNSFFNYGFGAGTKFRRKIIIDDSVADRLKISVEVEWEEKGDIHKITVQENLYDWK